MKERWSWYSPRVAAQVNLVRWGRFGRPVLIYPTAGGDCEECERMGLIGVLGGLIGQGRIKVYSVDSLPGRAWLTGQGWGGPGASIQNRFDATVADEVVPAIRHDCRAPDIPIAAAGASYGAFQAVAAVCRHPEVFHQAIALSGTFRLEQYLGGGNGEDGYFATPLCFVPNLRDGPLLDLLRRRFVVLASGEGKWEAPGESWHMAHVLGEQGIPNRVDLWGPDYDHDWPTWRAMLPKYLEEVAR